MNRDTLAITGVRDSTGYPVPVPVGHLLRLHAQLDDQWDLQVSPTLLASLLNGDFLISDIFLVAGQFNFQILDAINGPFDKWRSD